MIPYIFSRTLIAMHSSVETEQNEIQGGLFKFLPSYILGIIFVLEFNSNTIAINRCDPCSIPIIDSDCM